jgi:hypothetical protein
LESEEEERGSASEDTTCGSVRRKGAKMRALVLGSNGEWRGDWSNEDRRGGLRRAGSAGAAVNCLRGIREVVEEWGEVVVEAGCACVRARVLARRSAG